MAEPKPRRAGQAGRIDFSRARVLVAGDLMLDRYWFGDVQRLSLIHISEPTRPY